MFYSFCIIRFILTIRIIYPVIALLRTLEFQKSAKRKGHFALYHCLVLGHTGVQRVYCNPFPSNPFTAVIACAWSWLGSRVLIMAALLCRQIQSGMLGFCFCSQHLLWLILDPSPSNAHSYQRWKHTTILTMGITSIKYIMVLIVAIILIHAFQAGWNLSVPEYYMSLTTRNQFSTSSPLRVSWGNCQ